jgi:hypothetical protein
MTRPIIKSRQVDDMTPVVRKVKRRGGRNI